MDGMPTRSKKDRFMATLATLEKSSFQAFTELAEAVSLRIESHTDDMHRGHSRVDTLTGFVTTEFLYSDGMLQKRSKVPYTLLITAIKLFSAITVNQGPAHTVKKHCAELLYENDKAAEAFAFSQIEYHDAIRESKIRIFKRNADDINFLSEGESNTIPFKRPTLRSSNANNEEQNTAFAEEVSPAPAKTVTFSIKNVDNPKVIEVKKVIANITQPTEIGRECTDADNGDDEKGGHKIQSNCEEKMDEAFIHP